MITEKEAEYIFEQIALKKRTYKDLSKEFNVHYTTLCKWMKKYKTSFGLQENDEYCIKNYLKYKYKNEIIQLYLNGDSTKKIALRYNVKDDHLIAELLRDLDIRIRPRGYISKTNQSLFSNITTEIEAYTLGLITSDGSISSRHDIRIELHEKDKTILELINNLLCGNSGKISQTKERNTIRLVFCGKQICDNLKQYGVVPNKTYIMNSIYVFNNPVLMQHYLRGLFDGDGVCSKNGKQYLRLGYCSHTKSFTESFQNFLCQTLNLKKNKLFNTGGSWNCSWGNRTDIEKIYLYLYKNATIYLNRKKEKIENYLYDNTEVTN